MGKKGDRIRPCHTCGDPVNFVFWKMEGKKRIFHWANPDGSHHVHSNNRHGIGAMQQESRQHISSIINDVSAPWD